MRQGSSGSIPSGPCAASSPIRIPTGVADALLPEPDVQHAAEAPEVGAGAGALKGKEAPTCTNCGKVPTIKAELLPPKMDYAIDGEPLRLDLTDNDFSEFEDDSASIFQPAKDDRPRKRRGNKEPTERLSKRKQKYPKKG